MSKGALLDLNVLHALVPGAKVNPDTLEITVHTERVTKTVHLNIGGCKFETYPSTLKKHPGTRLSDNEFLSKHHRESFGDYFFDRDPDYFRVVLNYLRTGELHLPSNICGPSLKKELEFWGLQEGLIEQCCWNNYDSWNSTYESLRQLEHDRKIVFEEDSTDVLQQTLSGQWKYKVWTILHNPGLSKRAKIYGYISLFFVILSIFSFCAETHPYFQRESETDILGRNYAAGHSRYSDSDKNRVELMRNETSDDAFDSKLPVGYLVVIDLICLVFFTLEFLVRFLCSPRKLKLMLTCLNVIDLLAILPEYVEIVAMSVLPNTKHATSVVKYIAIFQVIRIFRIFRLIRHVSGLWIMAYTIRASMRELLLMVIFLAMGMLVFASLIHFLGNKDTFSSIPLGFWWALITMTTVGYGDMYPNTYLGYLVGSFCALSGLLMIGFTVPIIVNHFILYYTHIQSAMNAETRRAAAKREDSSLLEILSGGKSRCVEETHV